MIPCQPYLMRLARAPGAFFEQHLSTGGRTTRTERQRCILRTSGIVCWTSMAPGCTGVNTCPSLDWTKVWEHCLQPRVSEVFVSKAGGVAANPGQDGFETDFPARLLASDL